MSEQYLLPVLLLAAAALYSSVGHAGASAYLAVMALFGIAPEVMRPTALVLNVLVATLATVRFYRAGWFSWRLLWPFALGSLPAACVGGYLTLPAAVFKPLIGLMLLLAAARLMIPAGTAAPADRRPPWPLAAAIGAGIGLLAGLTGTGGGIFLSPVLILSGWAVPQMASGVAAPFILVNSISGLAAQPSSLQHLPPSMPLWLIAVAVGGFLGTEYGRKRLQALTLRRVLAGVLVIAAAKLVYSGWA